MASAVRNIKKYIDSKGGLFAKGSIDLKLFGCLLLMLVIGLVMLKKGIWLSDIVTDIE